MRRSAEVATSLPRDALSLSLQFADASHRGLLPRHRLARWLRAALRSPAEITLRVVGRAEGRSLNRQFGQNDHATNVLTFAYQRQPRIVADLVFCAPVVEREAKTQGIDLAAHYAHLVVHGALHAQGFDHDADADAALMEARESAIVTALGFADPYAR
ncbi:MAG: rRNA maturation RNase YbeY [Pseudomonadota bacterium]|nr:rRNA maturation RNase YbeY [Pseudomonadota bacterium]